MKIICFILFIFAFQYFAASYESHEYINKRWTFEKFRSYGFTSAVHKWATGMPPSLWNAVSHTNSLLVGWQSWSYSQVRHAENYKYYPVDVTTHRCRSRQIFGGAKNFCPNFRKFARKKSKENDLQKKQKRSHLTGRIFSSEGTSSTIFAQISPKLAQIFANLPENN